MDLMADDCKAQSYYGNFIFPTDSRLSQRLPVETFVKRFCGMADGNQFINQLLERSRICARVGDEYILIEALRDGPIKAPKQERSVTHDPFDIGEVLNDLLHRPLPRRISLTVE